MPMENDYPVRFPAQMRQHLRALRKKLGLTQAQAGALIGVSQSRVAEIESEPGLVSFEQMLQLLSAMGVTLSLKAEFFAQGQASQGQVSGKTTATRTRSKKTGTGVSGTAGAAPTIGGSIGKAPSKKRGVW